MTERTVTEWFQFIERDKSDLKLARRLLGELGGYRAPNWDQEKTDIAQVMNLITAIRLDQMAKEGSS